MQRLQRPDLLAALLKERLSRYARVLTFAKIVKQRRADWSTCEIVFEFLPANNKERVMLRKFWLLRKRDEDEIYQVVSNELRNSEIDDVAMIRARSEAMGDEGLLQSLYIKYRVSRLKREASLQDINARYNDHLASPAKQSSRIISGDFWSVPSGLIDVHEYDQNDLAALREIVDKGIPPSTYFSTSKRKDFDKVKRLLPGNAEYVDVWLKLARYVIENRKK